jgi:hypothetical protein
MAPKDASKMKHLLMVCIFIFLSTTAAAKQTTTDRIGLEPESLSGFEDSIRLYCLLSSKFGIPQGELKKWVTFCIYSREPEPVQSGATNESVR